MTRIVALLAPYVMASVPVTVPMSAMIRCAPPAPGVWSVMTTRTLCSVSIVSLAALITEAATALSCSAGVSPGTGSFQLCSSSSRLVLGSTAR